MSLARNKSDAVDLTQQTFLRYITKGHQIRDKSQVKNWLFTTLRREFLQMKRKEKRLNHVPLDEDALDQEEHPISAQNLHCLDSQIVIEALNKIDRNFGVVLTLFYMKQHTYREIAEILDIPIGTVMSRISRGKAQLRNLLVEPASRANTKSQP